MLTPEQRAELRALRARLTPKDLDVLRECRAELKTRAACEPAALGLALAERLGRPPEDGWHDVTPEDNQRAAEILLECGGPIE